MKPCIRDVHAGAYAHLIIAAAFFFFFFFFLLFNLLFFFLFFFFLFFAVVVVITAAAGKTNCLLKCCKNMYWFLGLFVCFPRKGHSDIDIQGCFVWVFFGLHHSLSVFLCACLPMCT